MYNDEKDLKAMKLLHYFITKKNYNPVIVHGIQNEIWLENMNAEFRIVRIVLGHIHNKEQLDFDTFKVSKLTRQIKIKTFTFHMKTLSFYIDLNEDVTLEDSKNNYLVDATNLDKISKYGVIKKYYSDISKNFIFTEEGQSLYQKINNDILRKNLDSSEKINNLFKEKKPIITYSLIIIMFILLVLMYVVGNGTIYGMDVNTLYNFGGLVKKGSIIRVVTSIFLHIGVIHFAMNMWALNVLGKNIESFYGHIKMLIIFLYSGIVGNLLSLILMNSNTISAGASGSIFGLMGSLLYFAINQRTYMGEALKKQILPVIILNLGIGFMLPSINMFAHIGGLVGGVLISTALGIKYKTSTFEKVTGAIVSILLVGILTYVAYFM